MESSLRVESPKHDTTNGFYDRLLNQVVELQQCHSPKEYIAIVPQQRCQDVITQDFLGCGGSYPEVTISNQSLDCSASPGNRRGLSPFDQRGRAVTNDIKIMGRRLDSAVGANIQIKGFKGGRTNASGYPLGYGVE